MKPDHVHPRGGIEKSVSRHAPGTRAPCMAGHPLLPGSNSMAPVCVRACAPCCLPCTHPVGRGCAPRSEPQTRPAGVHAMGECWRWRGLKMLYYSDGCVAVPLAPIGWSCPSGTKDSDGECTVGGFDSRQAPSTRHLADRRQGGMGGRAGWPEEDDRSGPCPCPCTESYRRGPPHRLAFRVLIKG
jgi:hypothetical protein